MNVEIIAEIGQNHQGSIDMAKSMIEAAAACGVDTVKFQKWNIDQVRDFPYDSPNAFAPTYREHRRHLDLDMVQLDELKECAGQCGVKFLVSAVDAPSACRIAQICGDHVRIKIPSCRLADAELRNVVSTIADEVILSTGMRQTQELDDELNAWVSLMGADKISVMHCVSEYPAHHYDLGYLSVLAAKHPWKAVGFSSHDMRIDSCQLAMALGATMIEKHFTFSRDLKGSDHIASLEPEGFRAMVEALHMTAEILGDGRKHFYPEEEENRKKLIERCGG